MLRVVAGLLIFFSVQVFGQKSSVTGSLFPLEGPRKEFILRDTIPVPGVRFPSEVVSAALAARERVLAALPDTLCIIGTGDIMLGTNYPSSAYLPVRGDCSPLLQPVHRVLRSGDVLFGNLEGVFCGQGGTPKKCKDTTKCYVFRMPDHFIGCLMETGFDLLSVANNHVNDFGPEGRRYTASLLDSAGIAFAGFTSHPWVILEKERIRYGFAAFAPHRGTMDLKDYAGAARLTRMLDSLADVVIISFHGGAEGRDHQHVIRADEEYLGYNRGDTYRFAHTVVDAGADIVFGHGPHVIRAAEIYRDRLICYSLGNFCTYGRFNLSGPNGIAPIVKVFVDCRGKFLSGQAIPVYQSGEGGPRIDPSGRAIRKLMELTANDFPDTGPLILPDGTMVVRPTNSPGSGSGSPPEREIPPGAVDCNDEFF